jgi:DNA-binding CsgD family transcriptional regulator
MSAPSTTLDFSALDLRVLLERDAELEAVARAVQRVHQRAGSFLVFDGPAGIGKTTLLGAAADLASDPGVFTLRARGAEIERDFVFGVVRQLFDAVLLREDIDAAKLFTGAARFAAPLLDVELEGAPAAPDDPFAARHALYWLTANLASLRPVVLVVDDCHWADAASLGVLAHIAHRLEGIPVALIVAMRSEESFPALDALRREGEEQGALHQVQPLGEEAAATIVRSFAPGADDALCHACHVATGGNPFMLGELARSVLAAEREGAGAAGAVLPEELLRALTAGARRGVPADDIATLSPDRVTREVAARLARLPAPAKRLAGATAVLGGGVPLWQAASLCGLDQNEAARAAEALVTAGVLRGTQPLEFLHPLVLAAVYAGLGPDARWKDHARAARLLAEGAASPERVAAQILRCQPAGNRWVYERLLAAARLASARGAPDAAATYLRRALEEPPPADGRSELLLALATAEAKASDPEGAINHLREVLAGDIDLSQRHRASTLVAGVLGHMGRVPEAVEMLEEQIEALAARPDLQASAEAALTNIARIDPAMRPRAAPVSERLRARVESGDERDPAVIGTVSTEMAMAAEPAAATADLATQALTGFIAAGTSAQDWSGFNAVRTLVLTGRYEEAQGILNRAYEAARERGSVLDAGGVLAFRGELHLHTGDLAAAEVDARALREIASGYGWPMGEAFATAWLGEALVARGELEEAEAVLTAGIFAAPAAEVPPVYMRADVLLARGRLRQAQERLEEAAEDMRESGRRQLELGNVTPIVSPWRSSLSRVLLELGEAAEARELAGHELMLARQVGAPRALSIALRGVSRLEEGDREIVLLDEAREVIDPSGAQLERARVHAALGAALRRAGRTTDAREPLRIAVDLAHRSGAWALERQALAELRATGARPRRRLATGSGALTPSERRIAELAADGQLNREIAEALFVTTNTVEYHLRNAYRKLGISSRTELAGALAPSG